MKKTFLTIIAVLVWTFSYAQEPDVGGTIIQGTGVGDNLTASPFAPSEAVSFTIDAGSSVGTLNWPPPGGSEFQVNITVRGMGIPVVSVEPGFVNYFAAPEIIDLGGGVYFISLLQDKAIPGGEYTVFKISGSATGPNGTVVGYQANGNPGGYNTTNTGNDDPSSFGAIDINLPVTLIDFQATKEGSIANLQWATTEETNSDYFEVQHSTDTKTWRILGEVKSNGESTILRKYSYTHTTPSGGLNYYRLRMVDKDETFAYSAIRSVILEGAGTMAAYPNPASTTIRLKDVDLSQLSGIFIYDMSGRTVMKLNAKLTQEIDVSRLPSGIYLLTAKSKDGMTNSRKISIQK